METQLKDLNCTANTITSSFQLLIFHSSVEICQQHVPTGLMYHNSDDIAGLNILSGFTEQKFAADEHTVHQRLYYRLNTKVQWPKENEQAEKQLSTKH